jgi:tripartite-type tricarboxylate transporter receptor subunit TctC
VVRFEKEIRAAAQIPTVVEKIRSVGFQPTARSSEELKQMQRAQFDRWGSAIKSSGFKLE